MKTTRIHVNQHNIRANTKAGTWDKPVVTAKDYTQNRKGQEAIIRDANGTEVARVTGAQAGRNRLACGAAVWIETSLDVEVL